MEKANKQIIYEKAILNKAWKKAFEGLNNRVYSEYNDRCAGMYSYFSGRIDEIVGTKGMNNFDDFIDYVSHINITPEQMKELKQLRKEPLYIRVMGEAALEQKSQLEEILGTKITSKGNAFGDEEGVRYATKTEEQLDQEFGTYNDKLSELLGLGKITADEYDSYNQNLYYIYEYYISRSKGEQVPFRKITNAEYSEIEEDARYNGISPDNQLDQEHLRLMNIHEEFQDLQSESIQKGTQR